jgi:hypothetical protein
LALRDHLKGHTEALESLAVEMLARGLSVRDIEDAFKDETGRLLLLEDGGRRDRRAALGGLSSLQDARSRRVRHRVRSSLCDQQPAG